VTFSSGIVQTGCFHAVIFQSNVGIRIGAGKPRPYVNPIVGLAIAGEGIGTLVPSVPSRLSAFPPPALAYANNVACFTDVRLGWWAGWKNKIYFKC
jgi:hypothetical protein